MIDFQEILKYAYKIPPDTIEKDYCLTWLLYGLSESVLAKDLIFYGGTALKKIYFIDYRYSEDLDFISTRDLDWRIIEKEFDKIYKTLAEKVNINFVTKVDSMDSRDNRIQFFVTFDGFFEINIDKQIKIDIVFKQKLLGSHREKKILSPYSDCCENKRLRADSLESIASDKILAIADLTRQEPRDIYDLNYLLGCSKVNLNMIISNLENKAGYVMPISLLISRIESDIYQSRWESRLKNQVIDLPEYKVVSRELKEKLAQLYDK